MSAVCIFLVGNFVKTYIRVLNDMTGGHEVLLDQAVITCGRHEDNDVVLADSNASRFHCRFVLTSDSKYCLEDVGSSNGTYVNEILVRSKVLDIGDRIQIGSLSLEVISESNVSGSSAGGVVANGHVEDMPGFGTAKVVIDSQFENYVGAAGQQNFVHADFDLDFVYRASLISSKNLTLPSLCRNFVRLVCDWANAAQGLLVLLDGDELDFSQAYSSRMSDEGRSSNRSDESLIRFNRELVEHVADCRLPVRSDFEIESESGTSTSNPPAQQFTAMCAPIDNGEKLLGVIYVDNLCSDNSTDGSVFSNDELLQLAALGKQAAAAIENNAYIHASLSVARNEAVGNLTTAVSHRTNNLLHLISGCEFLIDAGLQANDLKKVAQVWNTVKRAQNEISQLSVNMAMHCRDFNPVVRELNLYRKIQAVTNELGSSFGETRLEIKHLTDVDLTLKLDPFYLEQAIKNVLSVGLAASESGQDGQDLVALGTSLSGGAVLIRVSFMHFDDHFDLAQLGKNEIDKFSAEQGFLEMVVCRKLVECHGGAVTCTTEPGNLNTIEISFPLDPKCESSE